MKEKADFLDVSSSSGSGGDIRREEPGVDDLSSTAEVSKQVLT